MVLGDRGSPSWRRVGRCLCVWACGTAAITALALLVARLVWPVHATPASLAAMPFDVALSQLAALVLLGSAAWAWLALTVTVTEAALAPGDLSPRSRPWHLPSPLRRAVLGVCGVAIVSGLATPALASPSLSPTTVAHDRGGSAVIRLTGLPLPALPAAPAGPHRTVVVAAGDSLWSIAEHDLPSGATRSEVDHRWRQIYDANRRAIGPDPDVLLPGQRLHLPPRDSRSHGYSLGHSLGERPQHDLHPNP